MTSRFRRTLNLELWLCTPLAGSEASVRRSGRPLFGTISNSAKQARQSPEDRERWERLHSSAMIAIDHVLLIAQQVEELTNDAELAAARKRFESIGPDTEELRDLIAHEYALGRGHRQTGRRKPPLKGDPVSAFLYWPSTGGTSLNLGDRAVDIRQAATAAIELAEVAERVRKENLGRAETEANEALNRRRGRKQ
jgi:hypothetical protein